MDKSIFARYLRQEADYLYLRLASLWISMLQDQVYIFGGSPYKNGNLGAILDTVEVSAINILAKCTGA